MIRLTATEAREMLKEKKPHKYHAKKKLVDGDNFDSKAEADRYQHLRVLERCHEIRNLRRQVPFNLDVKGVLICTIVADFTYEELIAGKYHAVVEDFKGVRTSVYKLKKKLFEAVYAPLKIRETGSSLSRRAA